MKHVTKSVSNPLTIVGDMMANNSEINVGIIGLSHLGIIWSVGNADVGFNVLGYDFEKETVDRLNSGDLIIPEPGLAEQYARAKSRLRFSTSPEDLSKCNVVFFAKDVPYDEEGRIDLAEIDKLLDSAIPHLAPNVEFIFMGQVPVGYTRKLRDRIQVKRPGMPFNLIYRVETLTISQAVTDFLHPDRIIIGVPDSSKDLTPLCLSVLQEPFKCPVVKGSYESAELAKSAINIYLANAVTFVNSIADLCEKVGANINEIVAAMKLDKRFSPLCYWRTGLGFAGGHLERDLMSLTKLSEENGIEPRMLRTIIQNSKERYQWLVRVLNEYVIDGRSEKPTICLWGLAYKKNTDSLHNAHCLKVFRDFLPRVNMRVYDPVAKLPNPISGVEVCTDKYEALNGADAVVILTEWDEFKVDDPRPFRERMRKPLVIDCVQVAGCKVLQDPHTTYIAMGMPRAKHA